MRPPQLAIPKQQAPAGEERVRLLLPATRGPRRLQGPTASACPRTPTCTHSQGPGPPPFSLGAKDGSVGLSSFAPQEVVYTRNATEAINLVANTWGAANLREGDEIVLSVAEHHSNVVPWQLLAARTGAVLK